MGLRSVLYADKSSYSTANRVNHFLMELALFPGGIAVIKQEKVFSTHGGTRI